MIPSVASRSGGPARSTVANCRAVHGVAPETRFTLATTDVGLEGTWRRTLEDRMPPGSHLRTFPAFGSGPFSFSPRLLAWLRAHAGDHDLLVVRAMLHPISSAAARAARRAGVPYVVVPHGTLSRYTFEHRRTRLKSLYYSIVDSRTLAAAAAVRFTTEAERDDASRLGFAAPGAVIPHPHETRPRDPDATERLTGSRHAAGAERRVLFLSRLDPKKGLDVLLPAMAELRRELPEARLLLAGSGSGAYERTVRREIGKLGLEDTVATPGFLEGREKQRALASSDVFVLPSRQENFGVAAVEAMDAGLPVVVTRGVGIWREIERAGAGLVVERTPEAVASALMDLLADPERRQRMGGDGRALVRERFSPDVVGERLVALYRRAGDRSPAGDPEVV